MKQHEKHDLLHDTHVNQREYLELEVISRLGKGY